MVRDIATTIRYPLREIDPIQLFQNTLKELEELLGAMDNVVPVVLQELRFSASTADLVDLGPTHFGLLECSLL